MNDGQVTLSSIIISCVILIIFIAIKKDQAPFYVYRHSCLARHVYLDLGGGEKCTGLRGTLSLGFDSGSH